MISHIDECFDASETHIDNKDLKQKLLDAVQERLKDISSLDDFFIDDFFISAHTAYERKGYVSKTPFGSFPNKVYEKPDDDYLISISFLVNEYDSSRDSFTAVKKEALEITLEERKKEAQERFEQAERELEVARMKLDELDSI